LNELVQGASTPVLSNFLTSRATEAINSWSRGSQPYARRQTQKRGL